MHNGHFGVAEIETTLYPTLQSAIDAVPTSNVKTSIKVLSDISENVSIAANKNVDLNINGKTITNATNDSCIKNEGTLTFYGGTITRNSEVAGSYGIYNLGTLTMDGGTIDLGTCTINNEGTFTMHDGNLNNTAENAGNCVLMTRYNSSSYIYGGSILSKSHGIAVQENAKVIVRNAKIEGATAVVVKVGEGSIDIQNTSIKGTITNNNDKYGQICIKNGKTNYDISGSILGKVIATTWTGQGQTQETITVYNTGYQYMMFPTWCSSNGQNDIIWEKSDNSSKTHTITVKKSEHLNETGVYNVHFYTSDGNWTKGTMIGYFEFVF